jgi:hypothetical protein
MVNQNHRKSQPETRIEASMKSAKWLAALPVAAFFSGGWLSSVAPTFVLGMPFLMVWNVSWLVLTSLIMVVIDRAEGDIDAPSSSAGDAR